MGRLKFDFHTGSSAVAARSTARRASIAAAGAITPLVKLLGDGRNPSHGQVRAASALCDLARGAAHRAGAGGDDVDVWLGATTIATPALVYEQTMAHEMVEPGLCAA